MDTPDRLSGTRIAGGRGDVDEQETGLKDYLAIARRRLWQIVVPFVLLLPLTVAVALLLPPVYRSTGRILIEEPDIPRELAVSTISSAADKRLQVINQRVMTTENLTRIMEAHGLYPKERERLPEAVVVDRMRGKIDMELITVQSGGTAIAFTVSFEDRNPRVAAAVANDLTQLYLNENLRDRQFRATQTAGFFEAEAKRLEGIIADLEAKLAELRRTQYGSLPEQLDFNQDLISRGEEELRALDRQAQTLKERRIYLEAELTKLAAQPGGVQQGDRLKTLRSELTTAASRYGPTHPDVVRLRREVAALEAAGTAADADRTTRQRDLHRDLARLETDLAAARQRYTDSHPEVLRLTRQADALRASLAARGGSAVDGSRSDAVDNPAYVQLRTQLQATDLELNGFTRQREAIRQRIAEYERRIEATPGVQQSYQALNRALDAANIEYRDVRSKQMAAQMGELLESERKSERFSLIEPPTVPNTPIKPNRRNLLVLGVVLSLAAGIGLALLLEMLDTSVRTPRELARITGVPPLATIPYITTDADIRRAWWWRTALGIGSVVLLIGATVLIHVYLMPLGIALALIEQRLGTAFLSGGT